MEILRGLNMEVFKKEKFEVFSFMDKVSGEDAGKIIDKCVLEVPKILGKDYAGHVSIEELTKTLDMFLLDKDKKHNFFKYNNSNKEIFNIISKTFELLERYQEEKKYIFVFPCFDNFTIDKMNGVGGFCPKKDIIFLFLNLNGNGWESALKDSLIHEFAHAVSDYYLGGEDFNLGEGMVFDGLSENFRKRNFGGSDFLVNAVSEEECKIHFKKLKNKLNSKDLNFYREVFYGTGNYPPWLGYSLGYYLIKNYLKKLDKVDWNFLLRTNPKEILDIASKNFI